MTLGASIGKMFNDAFLAFASRLAIVSLSFLVSIRFILCCKLYFFSPSEMVSRWVCDCVCICIVWWLVVPHTWSSCHCPTLPSYLSLNYIVSKLVEQVHVAGCINVRVTNLQWKEMHW